MHFFFLLRDTGIDCARLRVILVAGLRYVPFFLYVIFLGVIDRSLVVTV